MVAMLVRDENGVEDAGAQPRRSSRRTVSRMPNPQSSRMRVLVVPSVDSTSSALPSLPLPRLANLTAIARPGSLTA